MTRLPILSLLGLAIALGGGPLPARAADATPPLRIRDLATDYVAFFDETAELAPQARVDALKSRFALSFPGFYDAERVKAYSTAEQYDARIAQSFADFPELRPRFERTTRSFVAMLGPAHEAFVRHFPDLAPMGEIYLLHSMGEMDGGMRTIGGRAHLVFGADVMARLYAPGDERPFFQHELFHAYHRQHFRDCNWVWCALWAEGLAVYVSAQLNPGASDAQLTLTMPRPIRPEVEADRKAAACAVRDRFDSAAPADYAALFMGRQSVGGLPPRVGYYVGYLVAQEAARTHSMQVLSTLGAEQARPIVDAALAGLADCTPMR